MNSNGSTLYRSTWDNKVTICVDARRIRYCAKQLINALPPESETWSFARAMFVMSDKAEQITEQQRFILENYYRTFILYQATPATVINDKRN